jgi:hypothetical protein
MSLWQLLRGSGYGGYDAWELFESATEGPLPLDPVDVAGTANVRALAASAKKRNIVFVVAMLALILSPDRIPVPEIDDEHAPEPRRLRFTNAKYRSHFSHLTNWGLLEPTVAENIKYCNTYFAVPKGTAFARAIFNGRRLSEASPAPQPVNLFDIAGFLEKLGSLDCKQGLWMVIGDFRHWFHQIPVCRELSSYFGLALSPKEVYRWLCLPMGWSHSPVIAQSLGWAVLCHREEGSPAYVCIDNMATPPTFVTLKDAAGQEVGFLALYYDNYIVVSNNHQVARAMNERIKKNAKLFNIALKEHAIHARSELMGATPPTFLGIELGLQRTRDGVFAVRWRIKNRMIRTLDQGVFPAREVARVIGKLLYSRLISLEPLGTHESTRQVLSLLARVSREAWAQTWNSARITITDEEAAHLRVETERASGDNWHGTPPIPRKVAYVATDASCNGWGFVILEAGTVLFDSGRLLFPTSLTDDHIFIKELHAAIQGIRHVAISSPDVEQVVVVVDNTAVAGVLRRRYSTNTKANLMLKDLQMRIRIVTVPSEANVADSPSRGSPIDSKRTNATWLAIVGDSEGCRIGLQTHPHPNYPSGKSLRHAEPDDDELISTSIAMATLEV